MIHDITGKKQLPAFDVFRLSIKYLMNHLQDVLIRRGTIPQYDEIRWVLIIPENFSERAKRSLRSCAEATYNVDSFIFALEPETISIFCQYLSTNMTRTKSEVIMYMVVDLGGDTADITVYQRAANGNFKEKHRASENNCGGTSIDHRFFKLLEEIFGRTIMNSLEEKCPLAYIDLIRELKLMKETVDTTAKTQVTLSIPCVALDKLCREVHGKNLETLLENFRNTFPDKRVIIPVEEDGLAVLKGAVLIGQRQDFIQYRGLRYSYGVKTNVPWKENKYDRKYYVLIEGEERCDNIFSIIFGKDESVEAGMLVKNHSSHLTNTRTRWTLWCMYLKKQRQSTSMMRNVSCYVHRPLHFQKLVRIDAG
ncbi:unnamed protein product [Mytilus edulis]|uniref:Uncharacterized protein n=1 Tax=Mytilus edulis TaxID=6550 RepID=A0A8S3U9T4_MYTED|nr:unnamed protein product [Mytilus edulis]